LGNTRPQRVRHDGRCQERAAVIEHADNVTGGDSARRGVVGMDPDRLAACDLRGKARLAKV
jgi:hypothetical protein